MRGSPDLNWTLGQTGASSVTGPGGRFLYFIQGVMRLHALKDLQRTSAAGCRTGSAHNVDLTGQQNQRQQRFNKCLSWY